MTSTVDGAVWDNGMLSDQGSQNRPVLTLVRFGEIAIRVVVSLCKAAHPDGEDNQWMTRRP